MAFRLSRLTLAVVMALALACVAASPAVAKPCGGSNHVPSGNSEVDQYVESVPGACGNETPGGSGGSGGGGSGSGGSGGSGGGSGGSTGSAVPNDTQSELESMGETGQSTAALANATAPVGAGAAGGGAGSGSGGTGGGAR